jgi:hypothetical protein
MAMLMANDTRASSPVSTGSRPSPGIHHVLQLDAMPHLWVCARIVDVPELNVALDIGLNARGKALTGTRVLVLGAAYKRDADDPRESPGLEILELLLAKEARAEDSDPYIPRLPIGRRHKLDLTSVPLTDAALRSFDAAALVTDHSAFSYDLIHRTVPLMSIRGMRSGRADRRGPTSSRRDRVFRAPASTPRNREPDPSQYGRPPSTSPTLQPTTLSKFRRRAIALGS